MYRFLSTILLTLSFVLSHGDSDDHEHGNNRKNENQRTEYAKGVIEGTVTDPSNQGIENVHIQIFNSNTNKAAYGLITDKDGYFIITEVSPGEYFAEISVIGYKTILIKDIILNSIQGLRYNTGTINLDIEAITLEGVSVVEEMPTLTFDTDKMVYTPSKDVISIGGSAEDVLNNVPMVTVDQNGSVQLKGSANVKVLVNGRENRMGEGGNDVDDIPASMIDKVEVITSPSAKYDPEGMAGIINIVLKKDSDSGFNAQFKVFSSQNKNREFGEMGGFSMNANYKTNKFNFYSSYSNKLRYRDRNGHRESITTYTDNLDVLPDSISSIYYTYDQESKKNNQVIRLGTDYYINKELTLNLEGRLNRYSNTDESSETNILPEPFIQSHIGASDVNNYEYGISFGLDKIYKNPDQKFSLSYSYDTHPDEIDYDIIEEDSHRDTTTINSKLTSQEFKLSYSHPFSENLKLEIGYDFDQTNNNEDMDYYLHVHSDEEENRDDDEAHISGLNKYNYERDIHAMFLEYNVKLNDKWSIKPGVRLELVNKNIYFKGTPEHWYSGGAEFDSFSDCQSAEIICEQGCQALPTQEEINECVSNCSCNLTENPDSEIGAYAEILKENNNTDYQDEHTKIYPSFHLSYNINEKKELMLGISSRVERPGGGHHGGSRQIRPFPREIHSHNFIFLGNPTLKPQYSTNYELSYISKIMGPGGKYPIGGFYANIYYHDVKNKIEWYSTNKYADFDVLTFRNADVAKSYGLEWGFSAMGQYLGGGFWYNDVQDGTDDVELNNIDQGFNIRANIMLPEKYIKLFGLQFGFYYMKMKDRYGSMFGENGTIWANAGITKSMFNKSIKMTFSVDNIFDAGGFSMTRTKPLIAGFDYIPEGYSGGSEYTDTNSSRGGRSFKISFEYNIGEMQKQRKRYSGYGNEGGGGMDMGY